MSEWFNCRLGSAGFFNNQNTLRFEHSLTYKLTLNVTFPCKFHSIQIYFPSKFHSLKFPFLAVLQIQVYLPWHFAFLANSAHFAKNDHFPSICLSLQFISLQSEATLQELNNALSNGAIPDALRPPLTKIGVRTWPKTPIGIISGTGKNTILKYSQNNNRDHRNKSP